MAFLIVNNVRIAGLSAAVPKKIISNLLENNLKSSDYNSEDFIATTGVRERRVDSEILASDLCLAASEKLIADLKWNKNDIEAIILVTQTGDYIAPATACIIQDKLGLSKDCYCLDINLGCSGWVYGINNLASIIQTGGIKKALLLVGDNDLFTSPEDMLFGCAGTATALEFTENYSPMYFNFGTDGSGFDAIIIPGGMAKNPFSEKTLQTTRIDGHQYNEIHSRMKGMDVFSFGISTAPKSIKHLVSHFDLNLSDIDYIILHQANKLMNDLIVKKLKISSAKAPISLDEFGNTAGASIPLTLVTRLRKNLEGKKLKLICCGFGVGLSWGSIYFETDNIIVSDLVEL